VVVVVSIWVEKLVAVSVVVIVDVLTEVTVNDVVTCNPPKEGNSKHACRSTSLGSWRGEIHPFGPHIGPHGSVVVE
jgi:hypothetical protein